ncbi:MAG: TIM barrel protein [Paracoccaceae bacterium]|nr:TIM barrel protein [Paracoccaceae bacterium]
MRLGLEAGDDTVAAAVELGIEGVPIDAGALAREGYRKILAPLRKKGLSVCQIGAFGFNPLTSDTDALAAETEVLKSVLPMAAETGCPYVVICGGNIDPSGFGAWHPGNRTDTAFETMAERLAPLLALAERSGARISIEPYLKTTIDGPEAFWRLHEMLGSPRALVANVDVTSHFDFRDYIAPGPRCAEVVEGYAGAYGLGHIKDIGLNDGFHIDMGLAPLGASPTDWVAVLAGMAPHMPPDAWLILEHVSDLAEARRSVALLRGFAAEAGVVLG